MIHFDAGDTPEEFWYHNLRKYRHQEVAIGFPQKLIVESLMKISHKDIVVYRGHLDTGELLIVTFPSSNRAVKNFIAVGTADCEYLVDANVEVYELDYNKPMTDEFVFDLLVKSHGWTIKDYGDLSGY